MLSALKKKAKFYFLDTESVVVYAATAEKRPLFHLQKVVQLHFNLQDHTAKMP